MQKVEKGRYVSIIYKGTLENGEVFDSNEGGTPLEIQMGAGQLIEGFETALEGMELNEKKSLVIPPDKAYGNIMDNMIFDIPRSQMPEGMTPEVGLSVMLTTPDGRDLPARMSKVDDDNVTMDLNHPLAGETLNFDFEIVGINAAPTQSSGCDCSSSGCSSACDCG